MLVLVLIFDFVVSLGTLLCLRQAFSLSHQEQFGFHHLLKETRDIHLTVSKMVLSLMPPLSEDFSKCLASAYLSMDAYMLSTDQFYFVG